MSRFSIVVPVYRAEKTITRCVESILNNSFKDLEVILIEDGSPDNTLEVCRELASRYTNVVLLENDVNHGVSYSRNRGLAATSGAYTMFVDSDDWVEKDYYETFDQVIAEYKKDALFICGFTNHDERQNGRTAQYIWKENFRTKEVGVKDELQSLYDKNLLQQLWNKAFITSLIKEYDIRFDEGISIGEDTRFILSYLKESRINRAVYINKPLYHYMRDQDGSLMFRVGYESVEEPLHNFRLLYELEGFSEKEIEDKLNSDRKDQTELYAYLIIHNQGMKWKEKYRLACKLDAKNGKKLFYKNLLVYEKEQLKKLIKR